MPDRFGKFGRPNMLRARSPDTIAQYKKGVEAIERFLAEHPECATDVWRWERLAYGYELTGRAKEAAAIRERYEPYFE